MQANQLAHRSTLADVGLAASVAMLVLGAVIATQ